MNDSTPRGATLADRDSLRELTGTVFRPSLMDEYPQLFHDGNLHNCRIVEQDGKVVSHVGLTIQDASINGCVVRVGCIGGVATYEDYRGRGHAGACLDDAIRVTREAGGDFMMISGDRSLYRRAGCRNVGPGANSRMNGEDARRLRADNVALREATEDDISILSAWHRAEPVHWIRPPATWERALDCRWVMNRPSEFVIVEKDGYPRGYFIIQQPSDRESSPMIREYAGDRETLLSAVAQYVSDRDLPGTWWWLNGADDYGRHVAEAAGLSLNDTHTAGTYIILNLPQLIDRLRPALSESVGDEAAKAIQGVERDGKHAITIGDETFELATNGCAGHFIFGTRENRDTPAPTTGALGEIYDAAFPVPALWYGVNYI